MTSRYSNVNKLLKYYDKCQQVVDGYKTIIKVFLENVQSEYNGKLNLSIKIRQFYKVGSSYEESVVSPETDFDIAMVLSSPFSMDCFKAKKAEEAGLYQLKKVPGSSSSSLSHLLNSGNFLNVEELKNRVCNDLLSVLKSMCSTQGFKIHAEEKYSGVKVKLTKANHETLKLDIIPQIEGNVNDLPDWNGENLPQSMKELIENKGLAVLFTLAEPPELKKKNEKKNGSIGGGGGFGFGGVGGGGFGSGSGIGSSKSSNLIVQANFNIIEKETLLGASDTVVDSVRISKGLLFTNQALKKGGLRSYQIKRVAMKYLNEIDKKGDSWDGYQLIMNKYIEMLLGGGVDGLLIKGQDCLWKDEGDCEKLGRILIRIFQEINTNNVLKQLVTDWELFHRMSV